jgi:hypothetical protein
MSASRATSLESLAIGDRDALEHPRVHERFIVNSLNESG